MKSRAQEVETDRLISFRPPKYFDSYVKLSAYRAIFLCEDFTKEMAAQMTAMLLHYDNENQEEDITIYILSDGGDASALANLVDIFSMISSPISTINLGKAYSAGAFLLAAGDKGKRFALKHSQVMIHGIQCIFPSPGETSSIDSKNYLNFINSANEGIMKIFSKNTGQTIEKVKKDCLKDFYLSAKEALEYGIIDAILE